MTALTAEALSRSLQSAVTNTVAQQLYKHGWAVVDGLFNPGATRALRTEIVNLFKGGHMHKNSTHLVKGNATAYVEKSHIHEAELTHDPATQQRAPLCCHLNQDSTLATMLSLHHAQLRLDSQAIKLQYNAGGGGCFPLHVDTDAALDGRLVTAIFYLNPNWTPAQGGLLQLFPWPSPPVAVEPRDNRLVLFSSARMLHRVTPSFNDNAANGATHSHDQQLQDTNRCCFTIWLSQERGRRRMHMPPSLAALQPSSSPEQDSRAAAEFLMQPLVRPHAMKLVYADEWERSLSESHAPGPQLTAMLEQHRAEVALIRKALGRYSHVMQQLTHDHSFAAEAASAVKWF